MFNNIIGSTKFTSDVASGCFENIYGDYFLGDASFVSTLRATLHNKIEDDVLQFQLYTLRNGIDRDIADSLSSAQAVNAIKRLLEYAEPQTNSLILYNIGDGGEKADAWFELIQKYFSRAYHGFIRQPKPTIFYKKAFRLLCFTNEDMKCSVIFVNNMSKRAFHYIQCGICGYLPWYFTKENLTEKDVAVLTSLRSKNSDDYISALDAIAEDFDFRKMKIKSELDGFENKFKDEEIRQLNDSILRLRQSVEEHNHRIGDLLRDIENKNIRMLGLQCSVQDRNSEIMEYFLANKNIELITTRGTYIEFVAKGYLDFFDEEMAQSVINNNNSYVYRGGFDTNKISIDQMKKLMTSIFVNKDMKIKTCAAYSLSVQGSASGLSEYRFDGVDDCKNRMPNPHIQYYSCLGNYRQSMNKSLQDFDFVSAIGTCCASVRSLNFGDATVMGRFMHNMYTSNIACIELKDGRVVTAQEAVKYIEGECQDEQTN